MKSTSEELPSRYRMLGLTKAWSNGVFLLFLVLAIGCGDGRPKRVAVSGQVLIDGDPVPAGSIRFVPEGARPSSGDLDDEGRFSLSCFEINDGAVVGTHRVQVAARKIVGEKLQWFAPQKYSDFNTSGLTVEITEPTESMLIELTWDGKNPRRK